MRQRLTVRLKLAAALLVPLVALVAFAVLQGQNAASEADEARRQADLASAGLGPGGLASVLQSERNFEATRLIGAEDRTDVESSEAARSTTDAAITNFSALIVRLDPLAAQVYAPALDALEIEIAQARALVDGVDEPFDTTRAEQANDVFITYSQAIAGFQQANDRIPLGIANQELRTGVELLQAVSRQNELESVLARQAVVGGLLDDPAATANAQRLTGAKALGEERIRALGVGVYAAAVEQQLDDPQRLAYLDLIEQSIADPASVELDTLLTADARTDSLTQLQNEIAALVGSQADQVVIEAEQRQRDFIYLAVAGIAIVALITMVVGRSISRPLRRLTAQANAMAHERLPHAVNEILETPLGEDIEVPALAEVSVRAGGEVAHVAEALNQVQQSAVELAVEQAVLRRNFADSFINLGRRNQNLLGRQLDLVSDLEREETDPETLDNLFKIDHLATRMRRNAESLLVLAGLEPPRQWQAPIPVDDVVRGALGEVEDYQRIEIEALDDATVLGTAASDVTHILAELLENGLQFSPPSESVDIFGRQTDDEYVITVVDRGFGMSESEIERANHRLAAAESFTVAPSRYLGHYVAAHLARRHGIRVLLAASPTGGVSAEVTLPAEVIDAEQPGLGEPPTTPMAAEEETWDEPLRDELAPVPVPPVAWGASAPVVEAVGREHSDGDAPPESEAPSSDDDRDAESVAPASDQTAVEESAATATTAAGLTIRKRGDDAEQSFLAPAVEPADTRAETVPAEVDVPHEVEATTEFVGGYDELMGETPEPSTDAEGIGPIEPPDFVVAPLEPGTVDVEDESPASWSSAMSPRDDALARSLLSPATPEDEPEDDEPSEPAAVGAPPLEAAQTDGEWLDSPGWAANELETLRSDCDDDGFPTGDEGFPIEDEIPQTFEDLSAPPPASARTSAPIDPSLPPPAPEPTSFDDSATLLPRSKRHGRRGRSAEDTPTPPTLPDASPEPDAHSASSGLSESHLETRGDEGEDRTRAASVESPDASTDVTTGEDAAAGPGDSQTEGGLTRRVRGAQLPLEDVHPAREDENHRPASQPSGEDIYSALADFRAGAQRGHSRSGGDDDWTMAEDGGTDDVE